MPDTSTLILALLAGYLYLAAAFYIFHQAKGDGAFEAADLLIAVSWPFWVPVTWLIRKASWW